MKHTLERSDDNRRYWGVCWRNWEARPRTKCPGVRHYQGQQWPEHLVFKEDLFARGLRLADGQEPAGVIASGRGGWRYLYDTREAQALEKVIESGQGKYAFEDLPDGFTVWRVNGLHVHVRHADTWLQIGAAGIGLYQYRRALETTARWFADRLLPGGQESKIQDAAALI